MKRPPLSTIIIFAIGQLGWSLASYGVINLIPYFYMPPEKGEILYPAFINQGYILGFLTIIGLIAFGSRIFDAITDPMIARYSDRTSAKMGRRKKLLALAALPFALLSVLVFVPLSLDNTGLNSIWLITTTFLFYFFMTLYVVPYNALIGELGHDPRDRMKISTAISLTWALGFALGSSIYALKDFLANTMSHTQAFQTSLIIYSSIAFACMLVPVLFLNENKYAKQSSNEGSFSEAFKTVFSNRNFRYFALSDLTYWLAVTFIQVGIIYYVTILLKMEESMASLFSMIAFLVSFLMYLPVNILVKKYGKKKVLSVAFILFAFTFAVFAMLGKLPIPTMAQLGILMFLAAIPLACFGIVPTAIVADIVNEQKDAKEGDEGAQHAGMYFAVRTFVMKVGITLTMLIFPSLLNLGRSVDNDLGIRLTAVCALVFCVIGFLFFQKYQESVR